MNRVSCACALLLLILLLVSSEGEASDLRLVVLDVGMGQSVLLAQDGHGLLVDTGLAEYATHVLARLKFHGVDTLDYLVLSHLHPDHAGGYPAIRKARPEIALYDNCYVPEKLHPCEQESVTEIAAILEKDPLRNCLIAGEVLSWQGHQVEVLWPSVLKEENLNHNSLVLLVRTKQGKTVLIMGDVNKGVERSLIDSLKSRLQKKPLDYYIAAHHAAVDSCDPDFLSILRPRVTMVSVGKENPFGYPSETSMAVLKKYSKTVLRTDEKGEICFELHSESSETPRPCIPLETRL